MGSSSAFSPQHSNRNTSQPLIFLTLQDIIASLLPAPAVNAQANAEDLTGPGHEGVSLQSSHAAVPDDKNAPGPGHESTGAVRSKLMRRENQLPARAAHVQAAHHQGALIA